MQKIAVICLVVMFSVTFGPLSASAQSRKADAREPDSEYMEKTPESRREERGGLFDFLPFVGRRSTPVPPEKLAPSPRPEESKPLFSEKELGELRMVAERWLLTSEFTDPKVRQDEKGGHYRDYIVFAGDYKVEVVRGETEDRPFVAYIYVKGDYFKTGPHEETDDAESDFNFKYQPLEFRVIFERVEKWEYSISPDGEPFAFRERWEFRGLQSRSGIELSQKDGTTDTAATAEDEVETPEPAGN